MNAEPLAQRFSGPLLVTLGYLLVYYALQIQGLRVRTRLQAEYRKRGERFDRYFGQDRHLLAADRYVGNQLEHMPPFLILLWLHAVFVDTEGATIGGAAYVATRIAYPWLMGKRLGRSFRPRVLYATLTGYGLLAYFGIAIAWAALG